MGEVCQRCRSPSETTPVKICLETIVQLGFLIFRYSLYIVLLTDYSLAV